MKAKKRIPKDILAAIIVTLYLLIYCQLLWFEKTQVIALIMLTFSPIMIIWMVYMVIRYGTYNGPKLDKEHFGYQDKPEW